MVSSWLASSVMVSLIVSSPPFLISTVWSTFTSDGLDVVVAFAVGEKVSVNNGSMNSVRRMIVSWVLFKLIAPLDRCYFLDVLCLLCRMYCTLSLFTFLIKEAVQPSSRNLGGVVWLWFVCVQWW